MLPDHQAFATCRSAGWVSIRDAILQVVVQDLFKSKKELSRVRGDNDEKENGGFFLDIRASALLNLFS